MVRQLAVTEEVKGKKETRTGRSTPSRVEKQKVRGYARAEVHDARIDAGCQGRDTGVDVSTEGYSRGVIRLAHQISKEGGITSSETIGEYGGAHEVDLGHCNLAVSCRGSSCVMEEYLETEGGEGRIATEQRDLPDI
jgi:hypothetical protein